MACVHASERGVLNHQFVLGRRLDATPPIGDGASDGLELGIISTLQKTDLLSHQTGVLNSADHVACPSLSLGSNHRRTLHDAPARLSEADTATDEGDGEVVLCNVVERISRCQDLALVDHVDSERLQHPCFLIMPYPCLGHHRDAGRVYDGAYQVRMAHSGHPSVGSDVRRDPLKGHHRSSTSVLGYVRLLGRDDIHDDAAFLHLGETALEELCAVTHLLEIDQSRHALSSWHVLMNLCPA